MNDTTPDDGVVGAGPPTGARTGAADLDLPVGPGPAPGPGTS